LRSLRVVTEENDKSEMEEEVKAETEKKEQKN
jgi:hypothetical protein